MTSVISYKHRKETKRIIIHDSHSPPGENVAEEVSNWMPVGRDGALRMGLMSLGYHFVIERDGSRKVGRPHWLQGSHTPGENSDSIGICLVGGRDLDGSPVDDFTYKQRKDLIRLCHELQQVYPEVTTKNILGHSEVQRYVEHGKPKCPTIDMDLLREDVELFDKGFVL